ncbi:glutamate 5-kinase, partial [Striga asiatica]
MTAAQISLNKNEVKSSYLKLAWRLKQTSKKKTDHLFPKALHFRLPGQGRDNNESIMPMEETNTSVRPYALGKELTPTTHKLLASVVDTPSPTAPEKEKRTGAKRSIDFELQTGSASNRPEVSYDDSIQESAIGTSSKRQKKDA